MRSAWQLLRTLFARVGSDPYYASYDRSLGNIKSEVDRVQAARATRAKAWGAVRARFLGYWAASWAVLLAYAAYVNRQPHGTYSPAQQAARVAPAFLAPAAGWLVHRLLSWLQGALDRRSAGRVKVLEGKLRKQVAELKDSTRYERTLALLQKYDPGACALLRALRALLCLSSFNVNRALLQKYDPGACGQLQVPLVVHWAAFACAAAEVRPR
jgi:hypothetical protein